MWRRANRVVAGVVAAFAVMTLAVIVSESDGRVPGIVVPVPALETTEPSVLALAPGDIAVTGPTVATSTVSFQQQPVQYPSTRQQVSTTSRGAEKSPAASTALAKTTTVEGPVVPPGGSTGSPVSLVGAGSGKCVDVPGASQTDGTGLIIWTCNGGANQRWTRTAAGELRVYNNSKCMDAGAGQQGTRVTINSCNGSGTQKWTFNANGTITNVQSGRCLDVSGGGTADHTTVVVWSCHGDSNQVWIRQL